MANSFGATSTIKIEHGAPRWPILCFCSSPQHPSAPNLIQTYIAHKFGRGTESTSSRSLTTFVGVTAMVPVFKIYLCHKLIRHIQGTGRSSRGLALAWPYAIMAPGFRDLRLDKSVHVLDARNHLTAVSGPREHSGRLPRKASDVFGRQEMAQRPRPPLPLRQKGLIGKG